MSTAQTVFDALQHVTFGSLSEYNRLAVLPLVAQEDRAAGYATLDEAMTRGWMKITEVTEAGHVPELKVENSGDTAVLIVDGEELVGAKQNRVVNLTLLIAAHKTMVSRCRAWSRAAGGTRRASSRRRRACSTRKGEPRRCRTSRSYAIDAIDRPQTEAATPSPESAKAFCAALASSAGSAFPGTGMGDEVRLTGVHVTGAALVADGRAMHVSGFPIHAAPTA